MKLSAAASPCAPTSRSYGELVGVPLAFQAGHAGSIPVTHSTGNPLQSKGFLVPGPGCRGGLPIVGVHWWRRSEVG